MVIAIIILAIVVSLIAFSIYIVHLSIHPEIKDYDFTYQNEIDKEIFTEEYYNSLENEEVMIASDYGYDIHGIYYPANDSNKVVILAHGYTYSLFGSIKYMPIFHKAGYNVFAYDQRNHGLSGGTSSTFGYREKDDLRAVVDYFVNRFGEDTVIGTHGESLGGATVLLHGAMDDRVDFIISDCSFSDTRVQLSYRLKEQFHLPSFPLIPMASLINRIAVGGFYHQVSPLNVAHLIKAPTLIIHGDEDEYTPYAQGRDIYDKLTCKKAFYGAKGATHAKSLLTDSEKYCQTVEDFLSDIGY